MSGYQSLVQWGSLKSSCVRTRGFKSHTRQKYVDNVLMAQWIERPTSNRKVAGSSPAKDYILLM